MHMAIAKNTTPKAVTAFLLDRTIDCVTNMSPLEF